MSRSKKGVNLINKNVNKFQSIITGLEKGIKLCETDIDKNNTKIQTLTEENTVVEESKVLAATFRDNLGKMLIGPTPAINEAEGVEEEKKEDK